jgi:N-acetyl-anhydromuramyl-L-alanine amidase AmpD
MPRPLSWLGCLAFLWLGAGCQRPSDPPKPAAPHVDYTSAGTATGIMVIEVPDVKQAVVHFEGPHELRLTLKAPAVACSMPTGIWRIRVQASGYEDAEADMTVEADKTHAMHLRLPPKETVGIEHAKGGGLIFDGRRLPSTRPLGIRDYVSDPSRGLARTYAGKKMVQQRQYDGAPVADLSELQWKIRAAVIHAFSDQSLESRIDSLLKDREGRHFLIEAEGQVTQIVDLLHKVPALNRFHDRTTVHIGLQIPLSGTPGSSGVRNGIIQGESTAMPAFTDAQHQALATLVAELNHYLPRIRLQAPILNGKIRQKALTWPRLFRGVLARYHADKESTLPGPGLDFGRILPPSTRKTMEEGQANENALWVKGSTRKSQLILNGPDSAKVMGTGSVVVCRPGTGTWVATSQGQTEDTQVVHHALKKSHLTRIRFEQFKTGSLALHSSESVALHAEGPAGFSRNVSAPTTLSNVREGTYRLRVTKPRDTKREERWAVRVTGGEQSLFRLPNTSLDHSVIQIAGRAHALEPGVKAITFEDAKGYSFYRAQKQIGDSERLYEPRRNSHGEVVSTLEGMQQSVRLVVLHADVLDDIETAFHVLHSKGLSSHFGIDFDGTIYQMLDPIDVGYGAGEVNPISIQIDLNNRMHNLIKEPQAPPYPLQNKRYRKMRLPDYNRPLSASMTINGKSVRSYGYTQAQYTALFALLRVLSGALPQLELDFPTVPQKEALHWQDAYEDFKGIVGHFHLTPRRWDPGPGFEWSRLRDGLRGH